MLYYNCNDPQSHILRSDLLDDEVAWSKIISIYVISPTSLIHSICVPSYLLYILGIVSWIQHVLCPACCLHHLSGWLRSMRRCDWRRKQSVSRLYNIYNFVLVFTIHFMSTAGSWSNMMSSPLKTVLIIKQWWVIDIDVTIIF